MKRILWLVLTLGLVAGQAFAGGGASQPPFPFDSNGRAPISKSYTNPWRIICTNHGLMEAGATTAATATDTGETARLNCKTIGPVSQIKLGLPGVFIQSGNEKNAINTVFFKATIEYPDGQPATPPCFTGQNAIYQTAPASTSAFATGCPWIPVYPAEAIKETNPLGVVIPGNSNFRIRYGVFVAVPPAAAAVVGSATTGALTPSTQYFYKATCVRATAESGPSTETSASTTGTVLNINVTFTYPSTPVGCDGYKLYRSTTTNTETFLASIPVPSNVAAPTLVYADAGQTATQAGTPPVANRWPKTDFLLTGNSTTALQAGGASTDVVSGFGTLGMVSAGGIPVVAFTSSPAYVLGDDISSFPVCLVSDSLGAGKGIQLNGAENNLGQSTGNYFNQAMTAIGTLHSLNLAISGTTMAGYTSALNYGTDTARLGMLDGCAHILVTLSINDLVQGRLWQQVALDTLTFARSQAQRGKRVYVTTLGIDNSSNDNGIAQQTNVASESQRTAYNTWVRNGRQTAPFTATVGTITSTTLTVTGSSASTLYVGAPVFIPGVTNNTFITALGTGTGGDGTYTVNNLQNTAGGAMTSIVPVSSGGTASPYVADYWDLSAAQGEVNAGQTPTLNGGFFPNALLLGGGTFSGSPTTTTQPFSAISGVGTIAAHSLIGITVKITSGAAINQTCVIAENTTSNITCNGGPSQNLTIAPAAGDTFNVYNSYANDGLHPTIFLNTQMATGTNALGLPNFQSFATSHFGAF